MKLPRLLSSLTGRLWRLAITPYEPDPRIDSFLSRAVSQEDPRARATVAVLTTDESRRLFGVDLARRGIQPVFVRIENRSSESLRLQMVAIDPRYFTPLEAAGVNHFSIGRRLSAFGAMGWLFLPLVALVPLKLVTAWLANGRMDDFFRGRGFRLGPIAPGQSVEGFVFTTLDQGTKALHVRLGRVEAIRQVIDRPAAAGEAPPSPVVDFFFTAAVPGIAADYLGRDFARIRPAASVERCDVDGLVKRLEAMPAATTDASGARGGDPVNLVLVGEFETLLAALAARHLFGRDQDIALQRTRHSINERLHLRLWLTPLEFAGKSVWVGQVSRDIGVRFTTKAWNLTTHRIDPDVDEARDYVIEDLVQAERVIAAGYVGGVGACGPEALKRNLTGDPYHTDGRRAVILVSPNRTA